MEPQRRYSRPMADNGQRSGDTQRSELRGIKDVGVQLGVTPRTLRFYEDKGLIDPQRVGSTRIYSRRDVGRMQLILRGKRLGFSLREIKEFLDLYDVDPKHVEQMRRLAERVRERLANLEQQRIALDETIVELCEIERDVTERIKGS
jgi:DNA-binding transcriptional MerR regulator